MDGYEIIQTHILFCEIRKHLEDELLPVLGEEKFSGFFRTYDEMKIKPMQIHRKKGEQ